MTLLIGPLVRYVDETCATVWVETAGSARVVVECGEQRGEARTFAVHGHHYALVDVTGLTPGTATPYTVTVDDEPVWPPADSPYPPSVLATLDLEKPLRLAFGSCRTSVSHDAEGNASHGVDALRTYALRMAGQTPGDQLSWPDLVLFLGDQVYADETTPAMQEFIEQRRGLDTPPGKELKDYEEYAHLYTLAWTDPAVRWLLSTLPTAMIFDDHDIRDDWNTSRAWKDEMEATSWWHDRIVGGLASYWVYQHAGNLSPTAREDDEGWRALRDAVDLAGEDGEADLSEFLDAFADRADQRPETYRWSFDRDFGTQARLVVVDSRAARVLDEDRRALLDDQEAQWLEERMRGDVDHLLVGTSLPFLLAPGLHYVEAFGEALAGGTWGRRPARFGEGLRKTVDLEHWAAFQRSFQELSRSVLAVARGDRGEAPGTVTFLSGDVHHSYVAEARPAHGDHGGRDRLSSRVIQAVCSPIRNPLSPRWRYFTAVSAYGVAGPLGHAVSHLAKVPDSPLRWDLEAGPWFDNNLATLEVHGRGLRMWWARGDVVDGDEEHPVLTEVCDVTLEPR